MTLTQHEVDTMPRLKILIVEDTHVNQLLATRTLEKIGHRTDIACNGVEAIKAVKTMPFDLILMDVNMPVMSGLEATRLIHGMQGDRGQIPILALTANAMKGDRERFLAAGMSDYVSKPLDRNKLISAINKWGVRKDQLRPAHRTMKAGAGMGKILMPANPGLKRTRTQSWMARFWTTGRIFCRLTSSGS